MEKSDSESEQPEEKKQKKKKSEKRWNMPTKPMNAFFIFRNERANAYREENACKYTEATSALAEMWSKMSEEEKMPYTKEATDLKVLYEQQMKDVKELGHYFLADGTKQVPGSPVLKKSKRVEEKGEKRKPKKEERMSKREGKSKESKK